MNFEENIQNGVSYVRINKMRARGLFDKGKTILLMQSKMIWSNPWENPCPINKADECEEAWAPSKVPLFDRMINNFRYYNCDSERGRGVKYFVDRRDLK